MSEAAVEILDPIEEIKEGWHCTNDQEAEWCIEQIRNAKNEKEMWKAHYKSALDSVNATLDETIGRMEYFLLEYFQTVPHKHTKTEENYSLPSGKIMMKAQNTTFEYDEDEVIQWLKDNGKGKFIKTKETLDWDGLKDSLTVMGGTVADDDAVVIPCIKAIEHEPAFKVQVKK